MTPECTGPRDDITASCHGLFSDPEGPCRKLQDNYVQNTAALNRLDTDTPRHGFDALEKMSRVYVSASDDDIQRACAELENVSAQLQLGVYYSAMVIGKVNERELRRKALPYVLYQLTLQNRMSRTEYHDALRSMEKLREEAQESVGTLAWEDSEKKARAYSKTASQLNGGLPSRGEFARDVVKAAVPLLVSVVTLAGSAALLL